MKIELLFAALPSLAAQSAAGSAEQETVLFDLLQKEEIVSQPVYLLDERGIDASRVDSIQIMFMSIGEPMLNFKQLSQAIEELYEKYPKARLLISASAPKVDYTALNKLSQEVPTE